ncbi:MAG TPA: hypothetical protein VMN78_11130 [Longimicrobiales bacterium]|nr:hypothetical protein [Longimicrobiales bacterium]
MRRIVVLVIVLALLVGAWVFRDRLLGVWQDLRTNDEVQHVSPELAAHAERKLGAFTNEDRPASVTLSNAELQSLVAYRMVESLPAFILSPSVDIEAGELRVKARVPTDEVAGMSIGGSDEILAMLPDTTEVEARAHLIPLTDGRVGLAVDEITAASIPLPDRVIPRILTGMGRVDEAGLPSRALAVRLPEGVRSVYAHGDSIVFVSTTEPPAPAAD